MKKIFVLRLSAIILFVLSAAAVFSLLHTYTQTDKKQFAFTPTFGDTLGWEFYTVEDGVHKDLNINSVLEIKGTYYLSNTLTQEMEDGSYIFLILDGNNPVAVFLDGSLFYTNCPDSNLQFDNVKFDDIYSSSRGKETRCTLPSGFAGKKLTVATAHGEYPSLPAVKLSAQDIEAEDVMSGVSKETILAAGFAVMALVLLGVWLFAFLQGIRAPQYLLLIAAALLQMFHHLHAYEFISFSSTALDNPFTLFIPVFAVLLPLVWCLTQMKKKS